MTHKTQLAAKIAAVNRMHRLIKDFTPGLQDALRPYIGKKVLNQSGVLSEKMKKVLDPLLAPYSQETRMLVSTRYQNMRLEIQVSENYPGRHPGDFFAVYTSTSSHLGDTEGNILTAVGTFTPSEEGYRTDYTEEEVLQARKDLETAKQLKSEAESRLIHFGEYDN